MHGRREATRADWCSGNALQSYSGGLRVISVGTSAILTKHFRGLSQFLHENDELLLRSVPTASFSVSPITQFISYPIIRRYHTISTDEHHRNSIEEN
jgi:hypothetical protein